MQAVQAGYQRLPQSAEVVDLRNRHLAFYESLARDAFAARGSDDERRWFLVLRTELDNVRSAIAWATQTQNGDAANWLVGALYDVWADRRYAEGRANVRVALELPWTDPAARVLALCTASQLCFGASSFSREEYEALTEEAVALAEGVGGAMYARAVRAAALGVPRERESLSESKLIEAIAFADQVGAGNEAVQTQITLSF